MSKQGFGPATRTPGRDDLDFITRTGRFAPARDITFPVRTSAHSFSSRGGVTSSFQHDTVSSPEASPDGMREGVAHAPLAGVVAGAVDARPVAEQAAPRMHRKPVFR